MQSLLAVALSLVLCATRRAAVIHPPLRTPAPRSSTATAARSCSRASTGSASRRSTHVVARALDARLRRHDRPDPAARLQHDPPAVLAQALDADAPITGPTSRAGATPRCRARRRMQAMDVIIDAAARPGLHGPARQPLAGRRRLPVRRSGTAERLRRGRLGRRPGRRSPRATRTGPTSSAPTCKNEPHGDGTWGTGGATDWRRAAERAGNAITAVAPNWLIVVEGIESPSPAAARPPLVGRQPRGRRAEHPVRLSAPNRLVYSPHEYGPGVFPQPWFGRADTGERLERRWRDGWGFIAEDGIAPLLDRRVRRPQGRPRQRRGPLAAPVPRPPRPDAASPGPTGP